MQGKQNESGMHRSSRGLASHIETPAPAIDAVTSDWAFQHHVRYVAVDASYPKGDTLSGSGMMPCRLKTLNLSFKTNLVGHGRSLPALFLQVASTF